MSEQPSGEICIGFGEAAIRMGGETVYDGEARGRTAKSWDEFLTFDHAAQIAMHYPESRVEVAIHGPFWGRVWEWRDGEWVVTGEDGGFA